MTVPKVRIKTDEQVRKKKRKRPETEEAKNKKKKLKEMKDGLSDVKNKGDLTDEISSLKLVCPEVLNDCPIK